MKRASLIAAMAMFMVACHNENSSTVGYYEEPEKTHHSEHTGASNEHHTEESKVPATDTTDKMHPDTTTVKEGH